MGPTRDDRRATLLLIAVFALVCAVFVERWVEAKIEQCTDCAPTIRMDWIYVVLPLIGGAIGLAKIRGHRRIEDSLLRVVALVFSIGLLARGCAEAAYYTYYYVTGKSPYPSAGDAAYVAEALLWIIGLVLIFWALETNPLEELRSAVDVLVAIWSLMIVGITLIRGEGRIPNDLGKLALDLFYPFMAATSCALVSGIVFGPQLRRISVPWRWCLIALYLATLVQMIASLAYSLLSSLNPSHPALDEFFWEGGPVDFAYALAAFFFALAVALIPRTEPLTVPQEAIPGDPPN